MRSPTAPRRAVGLRLVCVPLCLAGIAIGVTNDSPIAVISGVLGIVFAVLSAALGNRSAKTK